MGPEEETVEEAYARYIDAMQKREKEAERMRTETWRKWDANVTKAKRKLDAAYQREETERLLAAGVTHDFRGRRINGL